MTEADLFSSRVLPKSVQIFLWCAEFPALARLDYLGPFRVPFLYFAEPLIACDTCPHVDMYGSIDLAIYTIPICFLGTKTRTSFWHQLLVLVFAISFVVIYPLFALFLLVTYPLAFIVDGRVYKWMLWWHIFMEEDLCFTVTEAERIWRDHYTGREI